jgi:F0F1-type ATP synthase delta subunit
MKNIRFSDHALQEIAERKISLDEVVALLRRAVQVVPDKEDPNRDIYQEQIRSRRGKLLLLRAVVEEDENEIVVVTTYVTTQIRRYWRELR